MEVQREELATVQFCYHAALCHVQTEGRRHDRSDPWAERQACTRLGNVIESVHDSMDAANVNECVHESVDA